MNCDNCGENLNQNDLVKSIVFGRYHPETDEICGVEVEYVLKVHHVDCENPKGEHQDDYFQSI